MNLFKTAPLMLSALFVALFVACKPTVQTRADLPVSAPTDVICESASTALIAEKEGRALRRINTETLETLATVTLDFAPEALLQDPTTKRIYVCGGLAPGFLAVYDADLKRLEQIQYGHHLNALALSGQQLAVCDFYTDNVHIFNTADLTQKPETLPVHRRPYSCCFLGPFLMVANAVPAGASNQIENTSGVTFIDMRSNAKRFTGEIQLPATSFNLRKMALAPDGRTLAVPHQIAKTHLPPLHIQNAWLMANAVSFITWTPQSLCPVYTQTVTLDDYQAGAANPWQTAFSHDGKQLFVALAGSHELLTLDYEKLVRKFEARQADLLAQKNEAISPADDYTFTHELRTRQRLKLNGPRCLSVLPDNSVLLCGYFSDNVNRVRADGTFTEKTFGCPFESAPISHRGEGYFNDADKCPGKWFTCATCHPDGRADALSWDLVNDGVSNLKNTRSLLWAMYTPPCMTLQGIRDDAVEAIRAGFVHIQFYKPVDEDKTELFPAVERYLRDLKPIPSPALVNGSLSEKAKRGEVLFKGKAQCARCHNGPFMTDNSFYDTGTQEGLDDPLPINTPALVELFNTAPYLHSGAATTLRDAITIHNPRIRGNVKALSDEEIDCLCEYLRSL